MTHKCLKRLLAIGIVITGTMLLSTATIEVPSAFAGEVIDTEHSSFLKADIPSFFQKIFTNVRGHRRLSTADAKLYADIFSLQANQQFADADQKIADLEDQRLLGHVLYQRYMSPAFQPTYDQLQSWLRKYADHPGADQIYEKAKSLSTASKRNLSQPKLSRGILGTQDFDVGQLTSTSFTPPDLTPEQCLIFDKVDQQLDNGQFNAALKTIDQEKNPIVLSAAMKATLKGNVAQALFYNGKLDDARSLASTVSEASGTDAAVASWIAGLIAWQDQRYPNAVTYFTRTAMSQQSSPWMKAAGAHWTARSLLRAHQPEKVGYWLGQAAQYPRTFYGIISLKALGLEHARFQWTIPELTPQHIAALLSQPGGTRALALLDAGQRQRAATELKILQPGRNKTLQEAMVAMSLRASMPDLAMRLGSSFKDQEGQLYDAALYPDAPWRSVQSFGSSRALVHAFIRQESKFNVRAHNESSGATGLMQLMPNTAQHIARLTGHPFSSTQDLVDPAINLTLGQAYLDHLLKDPVVNGNLFKLVAAYNAGPGKVGRWIKEGKGHNDPLLFVESIPVAETRIFVERVMTNFWIYSLKHGQETQSLEKVAAGEWPLYLADIETPPSGTTLAAR